MEASSDSSNTSSDVYTIGEYNIGGFIIYIYTNWQIVVNFHKYHNNLKELKLRIDRLLVIIAHTDEIGEVFLNEERLRITNRKLSEQTHFYWGYKLDPFGEVENKAPSLEDAKRFFLLFDRYVFNPEYYKLFLVRPRINKDVLTLIKVFLCIG